jgi:hypothetical protein
MNWSTAARCGLLISALSACGHPAMAQHRGGGRPAPTTAPHGGNGGMHQVPPHIQQQMHQQQQMMMRQQQQMMQMQQQQMRQQVHQQYQQDVKRFDAWLKANGHSGSAASRLPTDPAGFDKWRQNQQQKKAQGQQYDPLYDHFRSFADSAGSNNSQRGRNSSGQSQQAAQNKGKNTSQAGSAGSMGNGNGTTTAQAAKKGGSTQNAKSANAQEKRAEAAREERRLAEQKREEARRAAARQANANNRRVAAQDQSKVNILLNVHSKLGQADHDYDGHRVHAMHSVGQAIHHLGSSAPMGGSGPGNLSQGQSDGILRDALHNLRSVHSQLGGSGANAAHHAQARASVSQAIQHLEVALRIR